MNPTLKDRADQLRQFTAYDPNKAVDARDDAKLDPISMYSACSASGDQTDDSDDFARAVFFTALAWVDAGEMLRKIARLHRHEGSLHVLVREPISQDLSHFIGRAVQVITGSRMRASNVFFHRAESAEWKRIWREKAFEAKADPL
jgi:hypothetical protein